jgi:hypothetical protein
MSTTLSQSPQTQRYYLKGDSVNTKIAIGVVAAVLLLVLMLPFVLNSLRAPAPEPEPAVVAPAPPPPPPPPEAAAETREIPDFPVLYSPPPRTPAQYETRQSQSSGPALTAETLVGTAWEAPSPYGPVTIELGPNGQAVAHHSMVGSVTGNWSVHGSKVRASVSFMGQSMSMDADIKGNNLQVQGRSLRKLR